MAVVAAFELATPPNQPQSIALLVPDTTRTFVYIVIGAAPFFRQPEAGVGFAS